MPVVKAIRWGALPYLPLNVHMYQRVDAAKPEYADIVRVWPALFSELAPRAPEAMQSWCCAQFAVTRAAVRARPRAFYVKLFEWVSGYNKELGSASAFISSRVLEQTWHMIFGMPPVADFLHACEVLDCEVLDAATAQVEAWEGSPFDRIPCTQDWYNRAALESNWTDR